jgi:hypothetical protein
MCNVLPNCQAGLAPCKTEALLAGFLSRQGDGLILGVFDAVLGILLGGIINKKD